MLLVWLLYWPACVCVCVWLGGLQFIEATFWKVEELQHGHHED